MFFLRIMFLLRTLIRLSVSRWTDTSVCSRLFVLFFCKNYQYIFSTVTIFCNILSKTGYTNLSFLVLQATVYNNWRFEFPWLRYWRQRDTSCTVSAISTLYKTYCEYKAIESLKNVPFIFHQKFVWMSIKAKPYFILY